MKHKIANQIIAEARESRSHYSVTGNSFDKVKANMYAVFECYAYGIIDWDVSKAKLKTAIREYVNLYPKENRNAEIKVMREEYQRMLTEYKPVLDTYKLVSEANMTKKLMEDRQLDESSAQLYSNTFYNKRGLTEKDLKDISTLKTWKRVMEAYPNLTKKDEGCVRMLTILENTYDTKDFEFNPRAGHRDQLSHPENQGLGTSSSPRPKMRPKRLAPMSSPRPKARPANLQMRHDINKAVQQAVASEGKSPHKKGTAKYKAHMAAMHAEGYKIMPPMDDKYQPRSGLEGPFSTLSGKVVYYDPKEGSYYDPDTDMYMSYDEFQSYDKDYSGMKDERDDVKEEMSDEQIDAFHTALDALVHKHLGHSSDERDDVKEAGGYYTQPVYDMIEKHGYEKVMAELLLKLDANVIQDFLNRADFDESVSETLSPEEKKLVAKMYNKDGTLTDLGKKVMGHKEETKEAIGQNIWEKIRNNALQQFDETTSAGAIASVAAPMGKMKRRKDSIFADKESKQTAISEAQFDEAAGEKDACYHKVKSRYKVWPSAYASGALVKCRKVGAKNWGNSKKK